MLCFLVWQVYRSYHKVHWTGRGSVWCSRCDWREQPALLIPLVLLRDISRKDIPLPVKSSPVFSMSRPLGYYIPSFLPIIPLLPYFHVLSYVYLPTFPLVFSLFHPTGLHPALQTWPYLGLREAVEVCGGLGWDYDHGDPHQNSPMREGRERVHTSPVTLLQLQQEELEEEFDVDTRVESRCGQRSPELMRMTSLEHYRTLWLYKQSHRRRLCSKTLFSAALT